MFFSSFFVLIFLIFHNPGTILSFTCFDGVSVGNFAESVMAREVLITGWPLSPGIPFSPGIALGFLVSPGEPWDSPGI